MVGATKQGPAGTVETMRGMQAPVRLEASLAGKVTVSVRLQLRKICTSMSSLYCLIKKNILHNVKF